MSGQTLSDLFKLNCLSRILVMSWEICAVNFLEMNIFQLRNLLSDENLSQFSLIYIFWHYYRNSSKLKEIITTLRYIKIIYWKLYIWWALSGCCPRIDLWEKTFLVIDNTRHNFLKKIIINCKDTSALTIYFRFPPVCTLLMDVSDII